MSLLPGILSSSSGVAWITERKDFTVDDTQTDGWTRTSYNSWGISGGMLYTVPNDGRVWIGKNISGGLRTGSVFKTMYKADNDIWGHNNWHQFGNSNADIKVTFGINSSSYSGYNARMMVYNSAGTMVYANATGISGGTWYVLRTEITATGYIFQIWNSTETTKILEYVLNDTKYTYIRTEMGQGTGPYSYMDWMELKY